MQEDPFIAALRAARAALGLTQGELAKQAGLSKVTIARIESGAISPRIDTLVAIQDAVRRCGIRLTINEPEGGFSMVAFIRKCHEDA